MNKFLYVFSEKDRDALLASHYNLLKSDELKHIYIFENQDELRFDLQDVVVVQSNTLTF